MKHIACNPDRLKGDSCACGRCRLSELSLLKERFRQEIDEEAGCLGEWLRDVRRKSGKSLRTVAHEALLSAAFLSDCELGRRTPTSETLERIIAAIEKP